MSAEAPDPEAYVVGAGPAGLAAAAMLRRAGVSAVVLERADEVGDSWRRHYDRLHLHTVRWLSHLPGLRFSSRHGRWVPREGVVHYLERYVQHHRLDLRAGVEVQRIERAGDGGRSAARSPLGRAPHLDDHRWVLHTPDGELRSRYVVVATGYNHTPFLPDWPGREQFEGDLIHASRYRNPKPYRGRDVLVVGSGNTGAEIAVDLAEGGAARVRLAVRTPPNIVLRESGGLPTQVTGVFMRHMPIPVADAMARSVQRLLIGDLSEYGLPPAREGLYTRVKRDDVIPVIDVGLIDAVKQGTVEIVAGVRAFEDRSVVLDDDSRIEPEAVVVAVGYRRGLEPLVGHLGLLDEKGRPRVHGPRTDPAAPGLHFLGYSNPVSGMFLEIGIDARRIARAVRRDRGSRPGAPSETQLASQDLAHDLVGPAADRA